MTGRERVQAAAAHREPDRVAVDLGGMGSTGISAVSYHHLRGHLGLPPRRTRINDIGQQLADIHEDVLERLAVDAVSISRSLPPTAWNDAEVMEFPIKDLSVDPPLDIEAEMLCGGLAIERRGESWVLLDAAGDVEFVKPDGVYYFDRKKHPLAGAASIADVSAYPWPLPDRPYLNGLRRKALYLRDHTDYALMGSFGGSILEMGQSLRGWGQFMTDLAMDDALVHYLLDLMADHWAEHLRLYLEAVGDCLDVIVFGDDLGTQQAPQLGLELYRKTIHPRHRKLYWHVREHYPKVKVFLHSCGAIADLIPLLIDEGVEILNPVQIGAAGMAPARLKAEYGKDITFWGGGLDTQHVLPNGTPEEIRASVLRNMEVLSPGGGFVFCQVHNIQANARPENIIAMYQAVREFNGQPLLEVACGC